MLERFGIANIALIVISGFFTFMVIDFSDMSAFDYVLLIFYILIVILGIVKMSLLYYATKKHRNQNDYKSHKANRKHKRKK